jgi:hypothetical protein
LPRARVTDREHSVFQYARLEPFLDQVDHAPIANPMLQEANQPLLADRIEGSYYTLPTSTTLRVQ